MVSFYNKEDPPSTMNTKTDDIRSDGGIPEDPRTVLVGIWRQYHPENDSPTTAPETVLNAVEVNADIVDDMQTNSISSSAVKRRLDRCQHSKQFIRSVWHTTLTRTAPSGVPDGLICKSDRNSC